ncbi:hypothetical protein [Actinomadura geliboluensis]
MERSRVTVEYSHLPGQVFEHEANGVYCLTRDISGPTPEDLKIGPVLEALEHALELWSAAGGVHVGFPPRVTDHEDEFRLVVPQTVGFNVWPAALFCTNRQCGHVLQITRLEDIPARRRCAKCGVGNYQQLPYFQVHSCGAQRALLIPACPDHPKGPVGFEDSASFHTAGFRCLRCRRPIDVAFRTCPCQLQWRDHESGERVQTPVTARDTRAFFGHHLTLVPVGGTRLNDALNAAKGVHYALGHYAGTVTDLTGLEDEARGRRRVAGERGAEALRLLRERHPDLPETILTELTHAIDAGRGDEPALEATEQLLAPATLDLARRDRRAMERAFLYAECALDNLAAVSANMRTAGHISLADRIDDGLARADEEGICRISVVRDFPVALVGYGYTREYVDPRARLAPLPHGNNEKLPLVAVEARTEGLLIELDPALLWRWCATNGWASAPGTSVTDHQARGWLLDQMYADPQTDAAVAIRRVTHAYSHLLIHALAYHSSYSSNSVAEYLLEQQASTLVYVAKYTSFNLGGLAALAEQHLRRWIEAATGSAWSCVHDPVCLWERGGCHKCLAVAFGCERFNRGLDRGYLVGGGPQDIAEGYLFTAGQQAQAR